MQYSGKAKLLLGISSGNFSATQKCYLNSYEKALQPHSEKKKKIEGFIKTDLEILLYSVSSKEITQ